MMNCTNICLLDLPNEILMMVLKKLNNMDVLNSLIGIGIERLDHLAQNEIFTNTLDFVSTYSMNYSTLDRFCVDILPRIQYNVHYLIVEAVNIPRILCVADYPALHKLKIFKFTENVASRYFTDESTCGHLFKRQITDLTLVTDEKYCEVQITDYTRNVYARIIDFCENLNNFNVDPSCHTNCPPLLFHDLPSTTFFSSTLTKLTLRLNCFTYCLYLLDGRLKQLSTLIVTINTVADSTSMASNSGDLPHLKCFSLVYDYVDSKYSNDVVPLLCRMRNLEELTLYIDIAYQNTLIDGSHLHDYVLIHMPQLNKFTFYIKTLIPYNMIVHSFSDDDVQQTFIKTGYEQVSCIVDYLSFDGPGNFIACGIYHVFSLPFIFDHLHLLGNRLPTMVFDSVTQLMVKDYATFKSNFFVEIARCFPFLRYLCISNPSSNHDQFEPHKNQPYSIVEYPHLTALDVLCSHMIYIELFLDKSRIRLPQLMELHMSYDTLQTVTNNFTREETRLNCIKIKRLIINRVVAWPKELYDYFPSL